jgi:hypothetical protein
MEAAVSFETWLHAYTTALRRLPEDGNIRNSLLMGRHLNYLALLIA